MLKMLRNDIRDFQLGLRNTQRFVSDESFWSKWRGKFKVEPVGDPSTFSLNHHTFSINDDTDYEEIVSYGEPENNSLTFYVYTEKEYEHYTEYLGLNPDTIAGRTMLIPYGSYRNKIDIHKPIFSLCQYIHDSSYDITSFRNTLDKNGFRFNVGHVNVFCTDIHFETKREFNRFKLIVPQYNDIADWFLPYINPGYFEKNTIHH